jgi:hypothetical protein
VSSPAEPEQPDARSVRLRWVARVVVAAIGLWFVADGLRGLWPGAGVVAQVLIVVAAVLGLVFVGLGVAYLARRGREG